ncbi:TqsA superfamily permease, member of the PurR regulon [Pseudomonas syringae pv. tomato]|nr:TqsA superfamily permease, member of the PurR regulon [Pseudomonas syringae pv. apii]KPW50884.1 TqsA superfamily permease, member of the PurR regulon [Pseudomonas syringae pv. antirrhini]KPW51341.1 putative Permease [Pseudomonas syringae pv. berberidis]KPX19238.1 TqsA superfamily permease, member of the PurR regulon [Pseudomonas syringae pv. delphinii]KPX74285.1 putative Permease [Pseudomonas syringae pv. maculicola]KPY14082.1 putative Permease [Pseudomonas syringae pv. philadelphi]KPY5954
MLMTDTRRWFWIGGLALLIAFVVLLHTILTPFLVALLLAYMGDPLVDRLERAGLSRTLSVVAVFGLFTLVLMTLLLVLVPMLAKQLFRLYELAPQILDWLQHSAMPWVQAKFGLADGFWKFDKIKAAISEHMGQAGDIVSIVLSQATASGLALIGWLTNLVLIPVVCFYLLRDWDLMMGKVRGLLPRQRESQIVKLAGECHEVLGAFIRGQLLVMVGLGVIYAAGLMLVGLELGLLIGVIAGLAAIVPYMGFVIGIGSALVAGLFQFGGDLYPMMGIVAVFMIGQALEGMVLTPLLVGDRIGLHPVAVIFAILAGGELFGFTGILLALPVAAVIMVLVRHMHDVYKSSEVYAGAEDPDL